MFHVDTWVEYNTKEHMVLKLKYNVTAGKYHAVGGRSG